MANRTIYALGGVCGSGKTYLRSRHPTLRDLECVDIGDIYQVADEDGAELDWREALEAFIQLARDVLQDTQEDFVVEAFLRPDGPQRQRLNELAEEMGVRVVYIWCAAPKDVCRARVEAQPAASAVRQAARLRIIGDVDEQWFEPQPLEAAEVVLGLA